MEYVGYIILSTANVGIALERVVLKSLLGLE